MEEKLIFKVTITSLLRKSSVTFDGSGMSAWSEPGDKIVLHDISDVNFEDNMFKFLSEKRKSVFIYPKESIFEVIVEQEDD